MATYTSPQSSKPIQLLYVDPDREAAAATAAALETEYSMDVTRTTRASKALEYVETEPVDCLVSDVGPSGTNGVELLEAVRTRRPDLPVVLLIRTAPESFVERARAAGVTDILRTDGAAQDRWLASRIATVVAERDVGIAEDIGEALPTSGGSCLLDERLHVRDVSELFANLYEYEPDELIGESWTTLFPADRETRTTEGRLEAVHRNGPSVDDALSVRSDGRTVPVQRSITAIDSDTYLCSVLDLTGTSRSGVPIERYVRQQQVLASLSLEVRDEIEPDAFFESVTTSVTDALDADFCALFERRPDGMFVLRSGTGWDEGVERTVARSETQSHLTATLESDAPVRFADRRSHDWIPRSPLLVESAIDSGLELPVDPFDRSWGVLGVYATERRGYSDPEIAFTKSVVALLGVVIERERANTTWTTLRELPSRLDRGGSPREVSDLAVDAVDSIEGVSTASVYLYDEGEDVLRLSGRTREITERSVDPPAGTLDDGPAWQAFVDHERTLVAEFSPRPAIPVSDPSLARGAVFSLGRHGVFVAAIDGAGRADTALERLAFVASLTRAALLRLDHERQLAERDETIDERTETVTRLAAVAELTRQIDDAIVTAASREELEIAVCNRLVECDPVVFAWIGAYDEVGETIEPRAWAGTERSYLNSVSIDTTASADDQEPMGAAVETGGPQLVERLLASDAGEQWRREATRRGYRSALSVPISYGDVRYGGLTIYADRPAALTADEQRIVEAIGKRVGHAFHALEITRTHLGTAGIVELEFWVRDTDIPFVQWAAEADGQFELENVFSQTDGSIRGLFTIEHLTAERVLELASRASVVTDTTFVTERGDRRLFTCLFTSDSVVSRLLEYGAVLRSMVFEPDGGTLIVELPADTDVRKFIAAFSAAYPDAELVRRHHCDRVPRTRFEFLAEVERRLTDRQYEVLRTAYVSGYYETPRESSGAEVAAMLDIAQPTFNHHLHAAQRKLLTILFDDE